jgi:hypothetical protein
MDHKHTENRIATQRIDERVFLRGSPADSIQVYSTGTQRVAKRGTICELSEISYMRP